MYTVEDDPVPRTETTVYLDSAQIQLSYQEIDNTSCGSKAIPNAVITNQLMMTNLLVNKAD